MIGPGRATRNTKVTRWRDSETSRHRDVLAVEEPLEIRVSWVADGARRVDALSVTMRTPGHDFDLVAGFLFAEGVIASTTDVNELTYCRGEETQEYNIVEARLASGRAFDMEMVHRNVYTTSSCGVCGKASLEAVEARGCGMLPSGFTVDGALIPELPDRLLGDQGVFARTGGLHAAGLFDSAGVSGAVREDVGRHNAVDKIFGHAFLANELPASERILVVSGRASFELVQKAVAAGVPMLVAVGAPSSLAVDLAARFGLTLIGFARDGGFNVYTAPERVT